MSPQTSFTKSEAIPPDAAYDPSTLGGKSVIVTGGASGIGEATVKAFVEAGAFVTFGDLAEDRGTQLVSELGVDKVAFVRCDVLSWADQLQLFKTALNQSPSQTVDIVIANAGISRQDDIFNQKEDENGDPVEPSLAILQTNLLGVAYTAKLAQFYFPKQPDGEERDRCLLITSSLAGYLDQPGAPQYNAAKWGVRGLMRSIRMTGPAQNIRVNITAPWFISTRIMSQEVKNVVAKFGLDWAAVEDAASAFLHLASDKSINGRCLTVVPRTMDKRGYYDLERDDWNEDDPLTKWHQRANGLRHRVGTDLEKAGDLITQKEKAAIENELKME